jgi:DNA-binding IclR family transcriptional regulator
MSTLSISAQRSGGDAAASPATPAASAALRSGTQAVERALSLLMQIAIAGSEGQRLSDLAARAGLDASTTHRLVASLGRFGFVEQDPRSRHYFLGLEFFSVAAAAAARIDRNDAVKASLTRMHQATGATALYQMRSGHDLVCIDIVPGRSALSGAELGMRRPIGLGAAGIAVLAAMPDQDGEDLVVANIRRIAKDPEQAIIQIRNALLAARRLGYAHEAPGDSAASHLAMAIVRPDGQPVGALSIVTGHAASRSPSETADRLFTEAQLLERSLFAIANDTADLADCKRRA